MVLYNFFPLMQLGHSSKIYLTQSLIDDANVLGYCQLFTTINNAALCRMVGSESRDGSNLKRLSIASLKVPIYSPAKSTGVFLTT